MRYKKRLFIGITAFSFFISTLMSNFTSAAVTGNNILVNFDYSGSTVANGTALNGKLSDNGEFAFWVSSSGNLVDGIPAGGRRVYKRDLSTNVTSLVTKFANDTPLSLSSEYDYSTSMSGRYIVFSSSASNIVTTHTVTNGQKHVYLRDTVTGINTLVDQSATGIIANASSGLRTPRVSDDGRFVVFDSNATNLLGSSTAASQNIFVKDMHAGKVIRITESLSGEVANGSLGGGVNNIFSSCDGSRIIFRSNSTNLTTYDDGEDNVYLVDIRDGFSITNLTHFANGGVNPISMSCNGRYIIVWSNATNITEDEVTGSVPHAFRYDLVNKEFLLVDKTSSGDVSTTGSTGGSVSNGGSVLFGSNDKDLVNPSALYAPELYLRDLDAGTTEVVTIDASGIERGIHNVGPWFSHLNARGDKIFYTSTSNDLVPGVGSTSGVKAIVTTVD